FFFQAEDGIRDGHVTGVQTCALPICSDLLPRRWRRGANGGEEDQNREQMSARGHQRTNPKAILLALGQKKMTASTTIAPATTHRSEERRVGKEGRTCGWSC